METPNTPPRISMQYFLKYILETFNLERGFFYTIREFFLRPAQATNSFLFTEDRKKFMKPLAFLGLLITISIFITTQLTEFYKLEILNDAWGKMNERGPTKLSFEKAEEIFDYTLEKFSKYFPILYASRIPFFALLTYMTFKIKKISLAEHMVINCFLLGICIIAEIILSPIMFFIGLKIPILLFFIFPFLTYAYTKIFEETWLRGIFKTLIVYVAGTIIHSTFLATIFMIISLQNPIGQ